MTFRPNNKYRRICFTANLPDGKDFTDYDLEALRVALNPTFLICQPELAPGTGQKHFQGYVELGKQRKGQTVMNCFERWGIRAHLEPAMGTAKQNEDYCSKEESRAEGGSTFRFGEPSQDGQGQRTDLRELFQAVKEGATAAQLCDMDAGRWAVHRKALEEYRMLCQPKRTWPTKLIFIWGPTGTGKTCHAQELEPETVSYRDPFLTGFTGSSENILFDDFNWRKMDAKFWLTLCDRYPMTVEVKGGQRNWAPRTIVFTSNDDPKEWWPESRPETLAAIHRRMDEFGTTMRLGEPVPHTQRLLTQFLSTGQQRLSGATRASTEETAIVDLTQDDSDEEHSQASFHELERRAAKRARDGKAQQLCLQQDAQTSCEHPECQ